MRSLRPLLVIGLATVLLVGIGVASLLGWQHSRAEGERRRVSAALAEWRMTGALLQPREVYLTDRLRKLIGTWPGYRRVLELDELIRCNRNRDVVLRSLAQRHDVFDHPEINRIRDRLQAEIDAWEREREELFVELRELDVPPADYY